MIVSRNWLLEYVSPEIPQETWIQRLTMSGLNHDGTDATGADQAIHLEVTSNRPDCLGHVGIAREVAAVSGGKLRIPDPRPPSDGPPLDAEFRVEIQAPQLCRRFTARLIRGIRVGVSPQWLIDRLATVGIASVNNIVDISNYVMLECGQPLHAFDFRKLQGAKIVVREPRAEETLVAIDHKTYRLEPGMCVIADGHRAVGLGGIMGGADTEVSPGTVDVLIEAAQFDPMAIRHTARKLNLHSPASYRFERTVDSQQIEWASRRCCQLILELAGGKMAAGWIDAGTPPPQSTSIPFRRGLIRRVLGIDIPASAGIEILRSLGFAITSESGDEWSVTPPSWRRDVTREIDVVEEIGRIHGYDRVPDELPVRMVASHKRPQDRTVDQIRRFMSAAGFDEAMTCSVVPAPWSESFSPWTESEPLLCQQPMLGVLEKSSQNIGAVNHLRRSLVPSLLEAFRINEYRGNSGVHLFEIANIYQSRGVGLPDEAAKLALVSHHDFFAVKGQVESLLSYLNPHAASTIAPFDHPLLDVNYSGQLQSEGHRLGYIGTISAQGKRAFGFRQGACIAELDLKALMSLAVVTPLHREVSSFPPIQRDLNFIVDDRVRWLDLEAVVRRAGGTILESIRFKELFRDEKKDGPGKKRLLLTMVLRSAEHTLTGEQADSVCEQIVRQCQADCAARLVA